MDHEKANAEYEIVQIVQQIDAIRESDRTPAKKAGLISHLSAQIKELKKITGPRHIVGEARL